MSRQADICRAVADVLEETFSGVLGVTVTLEDKCNPALAIENALGRWGVLVLVSASGHRRKPGTGASTAGDLAIDLTVIENPGKNRKSGVDGPTITSVAEAAKDALHWRTVETQGAMAPHPEKHRLLYVEMQRADVADDDYRMQVSFIAPLALDPESAVSWGIGDATILGEVTRKKVARGGVNNYEPGRNGNAQWLGTRDRHWRIELDCTVTTQSEDDLPEIGGEFEYGGRTYKVDTAEMTADAEDTATVRLTGRTMKQEQDA